MHATMTRKTTRPAKPRATPADDGWRALAVTTIEQAVDRYWETKVQCEAAYAQYQAAEVGLTYDAAKDWETWTNAAYSALHAAQCELIAVIVAWHGARGYRLSDAARNEFPPCAVVYGGHCYLATPDPQADMDRPSTAPASNIDKMYLVVMPAGAVANLDAE